MLAFSASLSDDFSNHSTLGTRRMLPLGHQRCSIGQISAVQVSVFIQGFSTVQLILSALIQGFSIMQAFLSVLIHGSAVCKNFQEFLVISASPRSALFEAALCEDLVYCTPFLFKMFLA